METIRILIVDDHEIIHNGLSDIFKNVDNYTIIGHAYNGLEAVDQAFLLRPDIIFMDISMPEMNGIEAVKKIRMQANNIKIIALTQHEQFEYVSQILKAGAEGYLLKNSKKEEFLEAVELVLKGKRYLSHELSDQMINNTLLHQSENDGSEVHLTRREIEIIQKIADDKSNQEIADDLNISLRTVETHRRNLMQKLKVKSVVAIIKYAASNNLIKL